MKQKLPGLMVCLVIALIAHQIGRFYPLFGGPVSAIVIGALISHFIALPETYQPGVRFCSRTILQAAIVLLGFGLNLTVILKTGWSSLPIIVITISLALLMASFLQKLWRIDPQIAGLIGVGSAICGGSAIAATAPILRADDDQVAQSISVIFLYNLLAAVIFPVLGGWLGFDTTSGQAFGLFAGTAVNDTSSVTAAASAWDNLHNLGTATLDYAVTVKLTRTLFIIPIAVGISLLQAKQKDGESSKAWYRHIPVFLLLFLGASVISSVVDLLGYSFPGVAFLKDASKFLIVIAMAGIGLNTKLKKLVTTGVKPILLGLVLWLTITISSLVLQHLLAFW